MENKEIIEGNKLIEVFVGNEVLNDTVIHKSGHRTHISESNFNADWRLLMPVVEKIEKLGLGYFKYHYTWSYYNFKGNCLWYKNNNEKGIMNLFFEVIEFIKWYNENK